MDNESMAFALCQFLSSESILLKINVLNKDIHRMVQKMKNWPIWVYKLLDEFGAGKIDREKTLEALKVNPTFETLQEINTHIKILA